MKGDKKGELRQKFLACRAELTGEEKSDADEKIRLTILSNSEFISSKYVAIFAACGDEPDLLPLIEAASDKIFLLPRYVAAKKCYELAIVKNLETDLVAGRYGILEPSVAAPMVSEEELERMTFYLVPLVSVDARGVRLGRGGGYYDRLLAKAQSAIWGVSYERQFSHDELPEELHDRRLNGLFTEINERKF